jgi:hypothetical protein
MNDSPQQSHPRILVDDDGPGLSPQERELVARRGRRLDETKPGSGLGLSIVVELASLYAEGSRWAPRRSAGCVRSWCCRGREQRPDGALLNFWRTEPDYEGTNWRPMAWIASGRYD